MLLLEKESHIRELIKKDPSNPEIYTELQSLIYNFLARKAVANNRGDREDIAWTLAADMFMKIQQGDLNGLMIPYISRVYLRYVEEYYTVNGTYFIQLDPSIDADNAPGIIFTSIDKEFDKALIRTYLSDIKRMVDLVMENSKYKYKSNSYNNLELSLILSLYNEKLTPYHLSEEEKFYLRVLVENFYDFIRKDGWFE